MDFSQGVVREQDGTILMRANGSFKLPKSIEAVTGVTVSELLVMKGVG